MILAGDIGGTKTVLSLFALVEGELRAVRESSFPSREHATFESILDGFLQGGERGDVEIACFGVAGPVTAGYVRTTNLPWLLEEHALERHLGCRRVKLLNDLEAAAYGMLSLGTSEQLVLNEGDPARRPGNCAVIAAGTGLGEAFLYWDGEHHHPIASEGGHASFAPNGEQEIALLRYLNAKLDGHVSFERILSGRGLANVYEFLRDTGFADEPAWLAERLAAGDASAAISAIGLAGEHPLCIEALRLFTSIYGSEAGNLALKCVAAEVFVGGGIAPKIAPAMQSGAFLDAFLAKGRFGAFNRGIRVTIALDPKVPLKGAAAYARRRL